MDRKLRIYFDTSIVSHLDQQDAPEKMAETHRLWERAKKDEFEIVMSDVVTRELDGCQKDKREILYGYLSEIDYVELRTNREIDDIAMKIISLGVLTQKSFDDCLHIATALYYNCDMIVSWNFRHIVNAKTIEGVRYISVASGKKMMAIYDPFTFMGGYEDG
jgi:predicted nucleic acid-binding protein